MTNTDFGAERNALQEFRFFRFFFVSVFKSLLMIATYVLEVSYDFSCPVLVAYKLVAYIKKRVYVI